MGNRRNKKRPAGRPRSDRHLHAVPGSASAHPDPGDFFGSITVALTDPEPLAFLSLASSLIAALDPRSVDPFSQEEPQGPDASMFLESLIGHDTRETTALLIAFAELETDNHLAQRARREANRRSYPLPPWLVRLSEAEPGPAASMIDTLGDGENALVSIQLFGGANLTAVAYIDHNMGTAVKDGFIVPDDLESLRTHFKGVEDDTKGRFINIDPANARAKIMQAIEQGAMTLPPFESDTWPACRPIVEWIIGRLPAGGVGFEYPEWSEEEFTDIADEFLDSPEGAALTTPDDPDLASQLIRFTAEYSGGDPLRWSPVNTEIVLVDWFARKIMADPVFMHRMPAVLRALVRYAHRVKEIPADLTSATLDSVSRWEPTYLDLIEGTGAAGGFGFDDPMMSLRMEELLAHFEVRKREEAADAVGGEEAFAALDAIPLPDEEFGWEEIPADVHDRVSEVLTLCDGCADAMFDVEMRTAFRRMLACTAAVDPSVFRRKSKASTAAAAIAWLVVGANDGLLPQGPLTAKELLAHFDVTGSVSQRAKPFLRAFGADEYQYPGSRSLGTPKLLTSYRRAELIAVREEDDDEV